jgi:hypothetical protein
MEEEQSEQLPFLNVMVKRQDNQLVFDVYIENLPVPRDTKLLICSISNLKRTLLYF